MHNTELIIVAITNALLMALHYAIFSVLVQLVMGKKGK